MMNKSIMVIFLATSMVAIMSYANFNTVFAQNITTNDNVTIQNETSGPIAGASQQVEEFFAGNSTDGGPIAQTAERSQDIFNGTNQSSGPISEVGEDLQNIF